MPELPICSGAADEGSTSSSASSTTSEVRVDLNALELEDQTALADANNKDELWFEETPDYYYYGEEEETEAKASTGTGNGPELETTALQHQSM